MCRVILLPHVAYRLRADWMDKDPRTGFLGLDGYIRWVEWSLVFPILTSSYPYSCISWIIPCESSLFSAFAQIIGHSRVLRHTLLLSGITHGLSQRDVLRRRRST
jgi:hypothetical protein